MFGGGDGVDADDRSRDGRRAAARDAPPVEWYEVGPHFFATLGLPVVRGRDLSPGDTAATAPVALVNETLARAVLPERRPARPARHGARSTRRRSSASSPTRRRTGPIRPTPPQSLLAVPRRTAARRRLPDPARAGRPRGPREDRARPRRRDRPRHPAVVVRHDGRPRFSAVSSPCASTCCSSARSRSWRCCSPPSASTASSPTRWRAASGRLACGLRSAPRRGGIVRQVVRQRRGAGGRRARTSGSPAWWRSAA